MSKKKSIRERVAALTYYGDVDESLELFQHLIHLIYLLENCDAKKLQEELYLFAKSHAEKSREDYAMWDGDPDADDALVRTGADCWH